MIDVFVSRPNWVSPEYQRGLDGFLRVLGAMELRPRTVGATDYPTEAPLDEVIRVMSECSGAVILGYPQLVVSTGVLKGTPLGAPIELPTEWNHIEAGLAYARGLPLLVAHHATVSRGVFDRGALARFLYTIDFSNEAWSLLPEVQGALATWKANMLKPRHDAAAVGQLALLRPVVSDDEVRVLKHLADAGGHEEPDDIAAALGISIQRIRLYLEQLHNAKLVGRQQFVNGRSRYVLSGGGRVLLAERGLI